jgi:hypothetical protein
LAQFSKDYESLNKDRDSSISQVLNSLSSRQNSRIELIDSKIEINRNTIDWEDLKIKYGEQKSEPDFKRRIIESAKNLLQEFRII